MKWIMYLLLTFVLTSCADEINTSPMDTPIEVTLNNNIRASVIVHGYEDEWINDSTIARLFDGNQNTWWSAPGTECNHAFVFEISLPKPVFVKSVRIINHGDVVPSEAGAILSYPGDEENLDSVYFRAKLNGIKNQVLEVSQNYYTRLLKTKTLALDLNGCYPKDGKFEIAEIIFDFSDQSNFNPEISASELKTKIKSMAEYASDGFWKFSGEKFEYYSEDVESQNKSTYLSKIKEREKYLSHLIYYGLNGDKEAEKLFLKYYPPGAASGEEANYIKSWYGIEIKSRGKQNQNKN